MNITAEETVSFTKRVADIDECVFDSATIAWGDGTSSAGQFETGSPPGVQGTHTYANEGTYQGTVNYSTDCTENGQVWFTATVKDAPLTAQGHDIGATKGQPVTAVVAHFTDASPNDPPGDFSAQIAWGDGNQSEGVVSAASGGGFDVTGTHTYQSAGQAALNVTIQSVGGSSASTSSTARIALEPLVASFTYSPGSPCPATEPSYFSSQSSVTFDASASGPDVTRYEWSFIDTYEKKKFDPLPSTSTVPVYTMSGGFRWWPEFDYSWMTLGKDVWHSRPSVVANLTVTDSIGRRASAPAQTISFKTPKVLGVVKLRTYYILLWGPFYYWYVEPKKPSPCLRARAWRHLARGEIAARPATITGTRYVTATLSCNQTVACGGAVGVVRFGNSRGARTTSARRTTRRLLGQTTINLEPGRTLDLKVPLNRRGRRLAKQRWKRVTLIWGSPKGKATTRTLKLRRAGS